MATKVNCLPFTIPTLPRLGLADLEKRFGRLARLMYDTSVPLATIEKEVHPYLAPGIEFVNPWRHVRGVETYRVDLSGSRGSARFDLDISQMSVRLSEPRHAGRALVDGTLYLRLFPRCAVPVRMILSYDFDMIEGGESFQITRHEEMWSFGDILRSAPLIGRAYDVFRSCSGYLFTGAVLLSRALNGAQPGAGAAREVSAPAAP
ncbi:hypothetical protein [Sorangium cellulosum]|uniref:Uncharacterized protein n=1 Tax=Sorangium cellulosum TaxID=56 RepID=A0A150PZ37_SORCE|nr:hypothetical protein [Sorangium cellulosum]KYF60959.1 hypothetical protein BE15_38445 [Sorangium cellulosum]